MEPDLSAVGIIGGGGGFRGRAQVGWLKVFLPSLLKAGAVISYLGGASVGALNLGKLAEAHTDEELLACLKELDKVWLRAEEAGPESVFPVTIIGALTKSLHKKSLLDGRTLNMLIDGGPPDKRGKNPGKPLDTNRIVQSPRRFDAFVTNRLTLKHETISNRDERIKLDHRLIRDAIKAAASIPPFFPPVVIRGTPYIDGGNITLRHAIAAGCKTILVLLPYQEDFGEQPQDTLSRLYPWIIEMFTYPTAKIRELDRIEISRAIKIAENLKSYWKLRQEIRTIFWRASKRKTVDRLILRELDGLFEGARFSFKDKLEINIIPVYIERQPASVALHTFKRGDLSRLDEMCQEQARRISQRYGLGN